MSSKTQTTSTLAEQVLELRRLLLQKDQEIQRLNFLLNQATLATTSAEQDILARLEKLKTVEEIPEEEEDSEDEEPTESDLEFIEDDDGFYSSHTWEPSDEESEEESEEEQGQGGE